MNRCRSALQNVLLSSKFWMCYHGAWSILFVITFPFAITIWKESVVYLVFLSQITALASALAGLGGSIAERKADPRFPEEDPAHSKDSQND